MKDFVDEIFDADNMYRTEYYIVKQRVRKEKNMHEDNILFSHDTYYLRTPERDMIYEMYFCDKRNINGRRLSTNSYVRKYVD